MFGSDRRYWKMPDISDDVDQIYDFFVCIGLIRSRDTTSEVNDNTFWEHVVARNTDKKGNGWCGAVGTVELTAHEKVAMDMFCDSTSRQIPHDRPTDDTHSATDSVCCDYSVGSVATIDDIRKRNEQFDECANNMGNMMVAVGSVINDSIGIENRNKSLYPVKLNTKEKQKSALQKLGNVQRYSINVQCIVDQFKAGAHEMKNVIREREKEIDNEKRRVQLIYDSVAYFKAKKVLNMSSLEDIISSVSSIDCESATVNIPIWSRSISEFDEDKYVRGEY